MKDWNKVFTASEQERLQKRLARKKGNATARGITCTLTEEDIFMLGAKLLGHGVCDYTGLPFSTRVAAGEGDMNHPKYPTIERIDDTKGYIRGNVCVVMQRANQLKDRLIDKCTAITTTDPIDRELVKAMMLNMSRDHLEKLKIKYLPCENQTEQENNMKVNAEYPQYVAIPENNIGVQGKTASKPSSVPEDVAVAKAYAKYCTDFSEAGMLVSVTYSQFKAKYTRKVCALTREPLEEEQKFILVLDLDLGFAKDNFIVVGEKIGNAITTMMIQTGISIPSITAMLNKAV